MAGLFKRWERRGIKLEKPEDGILLLVCGDFNDTDYVCQTWQFSYRQRGLVMWLLERYDEQIPHWAEVLEGKEKRLFAQYVPMTDCAEDYAHTIYEAHAYLFKNGRCREIHPGTYKVPKTESLYRQYYDKDGNGSFFDDEDDW